MEMTKGIGIKFDYRLMLIVPFILLVISIGAIANQYVQTGEIFKRSIELKGGTVINLNSGNKLDITAIENVLKQNHDEFSVRETRSFEGYSVSINMGSDVNSDDVLSSLKSAGIDTSGSSVEQIGPSLGESFWVQAQLGMILAFVFMGIIVFVIFRKFVTSSAVILSAVFDITMTLGFMQILGIELSMAGFAAILMLIGYSVDTDIMLTSRLMRDEKSDENLNEKIIHALKTGLAMTFTTIGALTVLIKLPISPVLTGIASILLIGLVFDIVNTWLMNSTVLKIYLERKGK
jgi:preprotein translocase subunit SecF